MNLDIKKEEKYKILKIFNNKFFNIANKIHNKFFSILTKIIYIFIIFCIVFIFFPEELRREVIEYILLNIVKLYL